MGFRSFSWLFLFVSFVLPCSSLLAFVFVCFCFVVCLIRFRLCMFVSCCVCVPHPSFCVFLLVVVYLSVVSDLVMLRFFLELLFISVYVCFCSFVPLLLIVRFFVFLLFVS